MRTSIKRLACALLVALALSGIVASAALAVPEFHSEISSTRGTGAQVGTIVFTVNSGSIHCQTVTGTGTFTAKTTTEVTSTPTFSNCRTTGFIEANVTVDLNGCDNLITADYEVHLRCPAEKAIQVTAPFCTITFGPQSATSIEYTNVGTGTTREIVAHEEGVNIHYTESGFACNKSGTSTNGTAVGSVRVTGESPTTSAHVGIWWTDE